MGVDVIAEDERGMSSAQVLDPRQHMGSALGVPGLDGTMCLRFVDLYGDTVFNQRQIPTLISELEALRGSITDQVLRAQATQSLEAAKSAGWAESIVSSYESRVAEARSQPVREHLDAVIRLVRSAQGEVHTYVRFRGD